MATADEKSLKREFNGSLRQAVDLQPDGPNRYSVITPITYDDGDLLPITLKQDGGEWWLSDEGRSFMHLSYEMDERDLRHGVRKDIIDRTLAAFALENNAGELRLRVNGQGYGHALYTFIHALLKLDDIRYLTRDRVHSTFFSDFEHFVETKIPESRRLRKWHDSVRDPSGKYAVDYRINGRPQPINLFALPSAHHVSIATIALHQLREWGIVGESVGVFQDETKVPSKVVARFIDVGAKIYTDLPSAMDRIPREFPDILVP